MDSKSMFYGILLSVLLLGGCATSFYKAASSGQIGCPEEGIEITDVSHTLTTNSWVATCKGKRFYCNSVSSSGMGSNQTNCKQALE